MANSFFDFNTSLNSDSDLKNGDNLLPDDEDCTATEEEEYDALNDETFGELDESSLDDWEQQHEQFAEINESSKHSDEIGNLISHFVLDDSSDDNEIESITVPKHPSVWAYNPTGKNGDIFNTSILSSLQRASKSFIETHAENLSEPDGIDRLNSSAPTILPPPLPKKICTVEELEKNLIRNLKSNAQLPAPFQGHRPLMPPTVHHAFHPILSHTSARLPPPGIPPMNIPPPSLRHLPPQMNPHHHNITHPMLPPGLMRMIHPHPHMLPHGGPPRPPGFMYLNNQLPVKHPFNFPPPPPPHLMQNKAMHQKMHPNQQHYGSPQQHQRMRHDSGSYRNGRKEQDNANKDEYAGLMTARDKQWLINIQLLQLNTGTPYFDDYYYTIFKERKLKNNKENLPIGHERNGRSQNNSGRQRRNSERQENTLTPRVYTPLQFENSLGKLQCGSVTAPRKIIDMDIMTPDKDFDSPAPAKDTRKTKQLLLELEMFYSLLLRAEDINNPMFISNMEKLRELKQKQRLRELEQAPTTEQKQEVLRLFKLESEPIVESEQDYICKLVAGLLQEDKFSSFLNIRKGKMLLLRVLPHLTDVQFRRQLLEIWNRVLLSLPVIGRRDTAGDNILPKLYPDFKRLSQNCTMSEILEILSGLTDAVRQENNRSTPLSHIGKAPLYFVVLNKFGVSALVQLLVRAEQLLAASDERALKHQNEWAAFLASWAQQTETVSKAATPIEALPSQVFAGHVARFGALASDKKSTLERHLVEARPVD